MVTVSDFISLGSKITADGDWSHEIKRRLLLERKAMTNLDSLLKSQTLLCQQGPSCQSYGFSSSHIYVWDYKESWGPKNWSFWTGVLEKALESPLDCKEIKPVHPKGNQSWIFIGRNIPIFQTWSSNTLATWCKESTHRKRPWCWERLKAEGDDKGGDGWMASSIRWTWVWSSSGS